MVFYKLSKSPYKRRLVSKIHIVANVYNLDALPLWFPLVGESTATMEGLDYAAWPFGAPFSTRHTDLYVAYERNIMLVSAILLLKLHPIFGITPCCNEGRFTHSKLNTVHHF